jgi:cell wall-associated NlpC family hydrolase
VTAFGAPAPEPAAAAQTNTTSPAGTVTSLQVQAQELAGQIADEGRTLDELASSYQAAQIRLSQLHDRQAALRRSITAASAAVATARQALKDQAVLAYLAGGAPIISALPSRPGLDPSLTVSYADIVAGGQKTAVQAYRATLDAQTLEQSALDATSGQATITLDAIKADAAQASAAQAAQQAALAQVKGQLAVEVAKVQSQQQAAEQVQEQAVLTARGDLPPGTTAGTTTATPAARTANAPPAADPPVTHAPATVTHAPATNPPATHAPATHAPATHAPATTTPTTTQSNPAPSTAGTTQAPGVSKVLAYARAQLGKPYQWAGAGPDSFDCSGLVMMAWDQAGIYFPHLAQDQYNLTVRIPVSALIPGDLVFFGTPDNVYHVGIYIGNGQMIDAPETGQNVQVQSIYWDTLLGAGRVTTSS